MLKYIIDFICGDDILKKFTIKHLTLIIIIVIIVIFITSTCIFVFSKTKNKNNSQSNQSQNNNITNNTSSNVIIGIVQNNKKEEHIYGYDENAMQVQNSYNGFPACGFLEIPKTNLALPILSNQTVSGMEYSCCMLYSTGSINLSGNTYIVGHNYNNGTLFSNNKNLKIGDKIILTGLYKNRLEYTIYNIFTTTPEDTSYLTRPIDEGNIELTIQTCNNDRADTRLIIEAVHQIKKIK